MTAFMMASASRLTICPTLTSVESENEFPFPVWVGLLWIFSPLSPFLLSFSQ